MQIDIKRNITQDIEHITLCNRELSRRYRISRLQYLYVGLRYRRLQENAIIILVQDRAKDFRGSSAKIKIRTFICCHEFTMYVRPS